MDAAAAVDLFWREVGRSSLRRVAKLVGVPHSTAAGWKDGKVPEGENRELLIRWAESLPAPPPPPELVTAAIQRTAENLAKLGEIRGQARSVLVMLQAVIAEQQKVVDSLEPWALGEARLMLAGFSEDEAASVAAAFVEPTPTAPSAPAGAGKAGGSKKTARG